MAQWQRIPLQYRRGRRLRLDPWVRMIPWRRKWQPTPAFLPEQSPGHGSLEGCSPGGCKESDMTVHEPTLAYRSLQPLGDLVLLFPYHVVPPQPTASGCYFPAVHWNCLAKAKPPNPVNTLWYSLNVLAALGSIDPSSIAGTLFSLLGYFLFLLLLLWLVFAGSLFMDYDSFFLPQIQTEFSFPAPHFAPSPDAGSSHVFHIPTV